MKGILLAGGAGTRLGPLTTSCNKHLLPIYDKPMIYYSLSVLMLAEIREILIISSPRDLMPIKQLFGNGAELGLKIEYAEQPNPDGIAQAFIIGEKFIAGSPVCLVLGDNIIFGHQLGQMLTRAAQMKKGAKVFAYQVTDPNRYGIVNFDQQMRALSLEEKPKTPTSNWAVIGVYFYDSEAVPLAKTLKPSARGELEITHLNQLYLERAELQVETLGRGYAWLDSGTPDSLLSASQFVQTLEQRQGLKIACLEEIAYRNKMIDLAQLQKLADRPTKSAYDAYLATIVGEEK